MSHPKKKGARRSPLFISEPKCLKNLSQPINKIKQKKAPHIGRGAGTLLRVVPVKKKDFQAGTCGNT